MQLFKLPGVQMDQFIHSSLVLELKLKTIALFSPLLHRLFLDHDITLYFKTTLKKFEKNLN